MLPVERASGRNPNPSPNPFVYPYEKTLLGCDDFQEMPGIRQLEEEEEEEDEDEDDDNEGLLNCIFSQHVLGTEGSSGEPAEATEDTNRAKEGTKVELKSGRSTRKRASGKTDRHSKIRTAQGLRDRRIRLSVQVSRKFFDLQDMLGFDKASNTIEWLITKSRGAIKGLSLRRGSSSSEGVLEIGRRDVSSILEVDPVDGEASVGIQKGKSHAEGSKGETKRDSRERARSRARERTREKKMAETSYSGIHEGMLNDSPNFSASDGYRDFGSIDVIEKFLGITSACEPSLDADPTGIYYAENANYSSDDRFRDSFPGNGTHSGFGSYYP